MIPWAMATRVWVLVGLAAVLGGCRASSARPGPTPRDVYPLSESEFDRFVSCGAQRIVEAGRRDGYPLPLSIGSPVLALAGGPGPLDVDALSGFAQTLAGGLADRGAGALEFVPDGVRDPRFRSKVTFERSPGRDRPPTVTLVVTDSVTQSELTRCSARIDPRRARERSERQPASPPADSATPVVTATPTPDGIGPEDPATSEPRDAHARRASASTSVQPHDPAAQPAPTLAGNASELLATLRESDELRSRLLDGPDGQIVFLSDELRRHLTVRRRTYVDADGRFRAELEVASKRGSPNGLVRVVFTDESGRAVEVSPVLSHRFVEGYPVIVSVAATHADAAFFLALLDADASANTSIAPR